MTYNNRAIALTALAVNAFALTFAYSLGRAHESALTIDAFNRADYATELLRLYVPQGERADAVCRAEDQHLIAEIEWRTPVVTP